MLCASLLLFLLVLHSHLCHFWYAIGYIDALDGSAGYTKCDPVTPGSWDGLHTQHEPSSVVPRVSLLHQYLNTFSGLVPSAVLTSMRNTGARRWPADRQHRAHCVLQELPGGDDQQCGQQRHCWWGQVPRLCPLRYLPRR